MLLENNESCMHQLLVEILQSVCQSDENSFDCGAQVISIISLRTCKSNMRDRGGSRPKLLAKER